MAYSGLRGSANTATQPEISIAPTSRADLFSFLALSQRARPKPSPAQLTDAANEAQSQVAKPRQVAEPLPCEGRERESWGQKEGGRAGGREGEKAREREEREKRESERAGEFERESARARARARARERRERERAASLRTWLYLSVQHITFITHHTQTHIHAHTHTSCIFGEPGTIYQSRDAGAQVVKADDEAKANGKNGNCKLLDDANDPSYPNTPGAQLYVYAYVYVYVYVYVHVCVRARACVWVALDADKHLTYLHTCICIHTYAYIHMHTYIRIHTYAYIHVHTYICIHTYAYIHTQNDSRPSIRSEQRCSQECILCCPGVAGPVF